MPDPYELAKVFFLSTAVCLAVVVFIQLCLGLKPSEIIKSFFETTPSQKKPSKGKRSSTRHDGAGGDFGRDSGGSDGGDGC
ncbi:hypothetical protein [Streptomyces sp. NPDC048187]|uniref:hypothetical protein n=1 Tax=Streptomyces sp. NPDC048187 TaxID=3365509 RepID=UPI003723A552